MRLYLLALVQDCLSLWEFQAKMRMVYFLQMSI